MGTREHWESVYDSKDATEVSWYQPEPTISIELIRRVMPRRDGRIIDVGGGASTLVDRLLADGYTSVTVLDVAEHALAQASDRLGEDAARVTWLVADVLTADFARGSFDFWHDRAVFHFLTKRDDRRRYVEQVMRAVTVGGYVAVATFASDGPTHCSGLEVARYDPDELHAQFGGEFRLLDSAREEHVTPWGAVQPFTYCMCRVAK
jgi:ubiquinone/menaquinone biosynthesis C-methylase UbiE